MQIDLHVKDYSKRTSQVQSMGFKSLEHYWAQWIKVEGSDLVDDDFTEFHGNNPTVRAYIAELLATE